MAADLHQAHLLLPSPSPPPPPSSSRPPSSGSSSISSLSSTPSENRGAAEEEEDDVGMDEFTAELTRRMAHYMLQEDDEEPPLQYQSGSESSDFGGGFVGMEKAWGSADSSPTSLWSPPVTPAMKSEVDSAREVMPDHLINRFDKMDLAQKGLKLHDSHSQMNKPPYRVHQPNMAIMSQNSEPRRRQFDRATPANNKNERRTGGRYHPQHHHHHHHRTHQVSGSGMQAVFLGGSGSRSGSSGTGVFLPRGAEANSTESRKQPRCSTVLIPARVAQALMTLSERTGSRSPASVDGRFGLYFQQKGQYQAAPARDDNDTGLPQEWIY